MRKTGSMKSRIAAVVLSFAVAFSAVPFPGVMASEVNQKEETEVPITEGVSETFNVQEEPKTSDVQELPETSDTQEVPETSDTQEVSETSVSEDNAGDAPTLQYVYVDQAYVDLPDIQEIVVSFDGDVSIGSAELTYEKEETREVFQVQASQIQDSAAAFTVSYTQEDETGTYLLRQAKIVSQDTEYSYDFQACGIEGRYGVNKVCETNPDAVVEDSQTSANSAEGTELEINVFAMNEAGEIGKESSVEEAIESGEPLDTSKAVKGARSTTLKAASSDGSIVVVLDPGHGGSDGGASGGGVSEKDLTLKIARYCRDELTQYQGVKVYMTRDSDVYVGLAERVDYAQSVGADLFVSIHLNASGAGTARGAEVYYPNSNYNAAVGNTGKGVAQSVQQELVALGLADRGIKIRDSENGSTYPDGSVQDYYSVIQRSKKAGFPGIIIEHAFIDNSSDFTEYLNSDAKLQRLGQADAAGIAKYIGLAKGGWQQDSKGYKFCYQDGTYAKDGWARLGGCWYYFDASGYRQTGWLLLGNTWYFLYEDGKMATGWLLLGSTWYYLDGSGAMVTGWQTIDGKKYYFGHSGNMYTGTHQIDGESYQFDGSGALTVPDGWLLEGGSWYYVSSGTRQTGWLLLGDTWYFLYNDGKMATGWLLLGSTWYYLDGSGAMVTGWQTIGGQRYYFGPSGNMYTGTQQVDGVTYQFDGSGALAVPDGWLLEDGSWYYVSGGSRLTGWLLLGSTWYYLREDGRMATGWLLLGSTWYYLDGSGAMRTGWLLLGDTWYYLYGSGAMATGWLLLGSTWYYLDGSGAMATGWLLLGSTWYYLYGSGAMATGWLLLGDTWYYLDGSGAMATGWLLLGSTWYYLDGSGAMATGWRTIGGQRYYFGPSGNMYTGAHEIDGVTYQFDGSGACQENNGWLFENGNWYYVSEGRRLTGWLLLGSAWYYMDASGAMHKGWLSDGNYQYYLNPSDSSFGPEGAMTKGYRDIDGVWYYFNKNVSPAGALTYTGVTPIMGASLLGNDKNTVVSKLVKMYIQHGTAYPGDVLGAGGAPDIRTFCEILYDEAVLEGVKPEVVFGQSMNETGYLKFGGDLKPEQFNFAGLGATGGGVAGNSYESVQIGLRAQVQHLKAYASTETLNSACVDNRFSYVTRGSAPYVEWLGIQENPGGKGWAASDRYGINLINLYINPIYLL